MADARITELPAASPVTGAEQVPMAQSGVTVRLSLQDVPVSIPVQSALDEKEPSFTKNTAFNKNFGTTADTVAEGNHTHLEATQSESGFMSSGDKVALDELNFPPATNDPITIGELALELTSDTTLTIKVRGSDNVVRSVALTLA